MKYLGIVEALEEDVRAGRVAAGERLPAQRAVAEALDVDLTTVTRAFNEARRRGLISAQAGRGTYIAESSEETDAEVRHSLLDLSMNIPPQPATVDFRKLLSEGVAEVLGGQKGLLHLHYQESTGAGQDRVAATSWLSRTTGAVSPDRVIVAGGAQSALYAICELLLDRGDVVAAGAMTYPGFKAVAFQMGLIIEPLAMDENGIVPDAFARACHERRLKALYVIPTMDNPTTASLSGDRRRELAMIARKYGVALIEDDPYAPLAENRTVSLCELEPALTWHIATLSKCSTPALRVAYVVTPDPTAALRLAGVLRATMLMAPPLMVALASRWIADGRLDEIAKAIRAESEARQELAASILGDFNFVANPYGHHLWLRLPPFWRAFDFAEHANRAGVSIVPAAAFSISASPVEAVRISLGVAPDQGVLEDGLNLLAALIRQPSLGSKAVV
ncbi:aminotransferase-like domain-containing protein [Martelella alba]|nr:PLP-dependent aminotransferase family protein [Martelella alba]